MDRRYDVVTFDCYGTLIDWESGIAGAFRRQEPGLDRDAILTAYAEVEPQVESAYDFYRNVLAKTAREVGRKLGWSTDGTFLPDSLPDWKPFADTNPALERLKHAGYRLGILSNVDDDLLEKTRRHFTVDFDLIVTAQQVRSYKPGRAHFDRAKEMIGNARWLHAAQSNFHDVVPVNAFGVDTAWVNRHGERPLPGGTPTHEVRDMAGLAELLA
ncbi:MAG TPA: HAD-IA family hydrolase [Thermoanaerobaculia bacterium]|jgi:2-haloacid dehalogenase/putative hydrolase of the HAD superfamily